MVTAVLFDKSSLFLTLYGLVCRMCMCAPVRSVVARTVRGAREWEIEKWAQMFLYKIR